MENYSGNGLVVIFDPLGYEDGGFRRGTRFGPVEAMCMLTEEAFTQGTIVQDIKTKEYFQYVRSELVLAPKKVYAGG